MHLYIVPLLLLLVCGEPRPTPPHFDPLRSLILTACGVLVAGALAELPAALLTHRIWYRRGDRQRQYVAYARLKKAHLLLSAAVFLFAVFVGDWDCLVLDTLRLKAALPLAVGPLILPFLLSMLVAWAAFYRVELALHQTASQAAQAHAFWTRDQFLLFHLRQQFGLWVAVWTTYLALDLLTEQALGLFLADAAWRRNVASVTALVAVGLLLPRILTHVLATEPLPAAPLRAKLEATLKRLKLPSTDLRLWRTNGNMANALVVGLFPSSRSVLLSDLLVDSLGPEQIEAVVGHELGHIRHRHLFLYAAFILLSCLLFTLAGEALKTQLASVMTWSFELPWAAQVSASAALASAAALVVGGLYFWIVYGALSRLCERQADIFGCKAVQASPGAPALSADGLSANAAEKANETGAPTLHAHGIQVFVSTLLRVADVNGMNPRAPGWLHGSIAQRVAFLENLLYDPDAEPRFQRQALYFKLGLILTLLGLVGLCWWLTGGITLS